MTNRARCCRATAVWFSAFALSCSALAQTPPERLASRAVASRIAEIDGQLRRQEWQPARDAALQLIDTIRATLMASDLAATVARLALADAGRGEEETARWRWHIAQNLDRAVLSPDELAAYGPPGELLARHPLRPLDGPPAGLSVLSADAPDVKPGRLLSGALPKLSNALADVRVPKSLRLQAVIDADGRLREPVVVAGAVPGMIYEVLEGLREWRYEPARHGDQPIAVFRTVSINPPAEKPLSTIAPLAADLQKIEALLRTGSWAPARKQSQDTWKRLLDREGYSPQDLASLLALRALAEAGLGKEAEAICRWQAAQHVNPALFDADLSPYGAAGALLEKHRWGEAPPDSFGGTAEIAGRRDVFYPISLRWRPIQGVILFAATVNRDGSVRQPVVLRLQSGDHVFLLGLEPPVQFEPDAKTVLASQIVAASALDALCDWRLQTDGGTGTAPFQAVFTLPFKSPRTGYAGYPQELPRPGVITPGHDVDPKNPPVGGVSSGPPGGPPR